MKMFKKVVSLALSAALAFTGAFAFSATEVYAADSYTAVLGFADGDWYPQEWGDNVKTTVKGAGTYTLSYTAESVAEGLTVFVIDIKGGASLADTAPLTAVSMKADGKDVAVDFSKVLTGDIEENGNYRIEFYNEFGNTKSAPAVSNTLSFTSLEITFTLGEQAAAADTASAASKQTQTISVSGNKKTFKATDLAKAAKTFSVQAIAKTAPSFTAKSDKTGNVSIDTSGKVTVKKGTAAGTYKIATKVVAKASSVYKKATKKVTVKVVVK